MKRLICLGLIVAAGYLWEGCRENSVAPPTAGVGTTSVVDTPSKHGMAGGDTLSSLRNAEPVLPASRKEPEGAVRKRFLEEKAEDTNIRLGR